MPRIITINRICVGVSMMLLFVSCAGVGEGCTRQEIPFELKNGRIILDARVNGKRGKFLLDTGASASLTTIRVNNLKRIRTTELLALDEAFVTQVYALNTITLGKVKLHPEAEIIPALGKERKMLETEGLKGILDFYIFTGYWCEISFSQNKIFLYKERPLSFQESVPVEMIAKSFFCVPVTIDGETIPFSIDTGMAEAIRFPKSVVNQKDSTDYAKVNSTDRVKNFYVVKTNTVSIFDEVFKDKYVLTNSYIAQNQNASQKTTDTDLFDTIGILGIGFLRNYNLLFDFTDARYFTSSKLYYKPSFLFKENDYGLYNRPITDIHPFGILRIHRTRQGIVIQDIIENSIAYTTYGLRPGMMVTKVNGEAINNITFEELVVPDFSDKVSEYTISENGIERTIKLARN